MKKSLTLLFGMLAAVLCAAPIKVACIGDSITFGYGLSNREENSYPAQLQKLLGSRYEVRNFGNSGRGIYLHTWREKDRSDPRSHRGYRYQDECKEALKWKPDIVICNLGINDNGEYLTYERKNPGAWQKDYLTLLGDFQKLPTKPKLYIWGKLAPLAPGQPFYRSSEPFLMQTDLEAIAEKTGATLIDMQEPLRDKLLTCFPDKIHPNEEGAKIIAQTTYEVLTEKPFKGETKTTKRTGNGNWEAQVGWGEPLPAQEPVALPREIAGRAETWLCAGQSNMFWPLKRCANAKEEAAATAKLNIWVWDFVPGAWTKLTPQNAGDFSAMAVSFAIRRAQATRKPVAILLVGVGGAPTEAFLNEPTMAAVDSMGKPLYPHLQKIVTTRKQIDTNEDFPCTWCAQEYRKRMKGEGGGWALNILYRNGIARVKHLPLTGILWYQGESNATTGVGNRAGAPLDEAYMEETLRAIVSELRPSRNTPFLMVGLPVMNRDWAPYRALQEKVCKDTGAIYLDTFGAGLGDPNNVHPANKIPFAEMASKAASKALGR